MEFGHNHTLKKIQDSVLLLLNETKHSIQARNKNNHTTNLRKGKGKNKYKTRN